jgi:protein-S-isoprenylcysteine O-methyltransferase Ste14
MFFVVQVIVCFLWLVGIAFWIVSAFGNKRTVRRVSMPSRFLIAAILIAVIIALRLVQPGLQLRQYIPETPLFALIGLALVLAGVSFAIWARVAIGTNWSGIVTIKEDHVLITKGPYAYVRHPIYTGILLGLLGTGIVFRSVHELLVSVAAFILLIFKARLEEQLMVEQFGDEYKEYRKKVKGFIPYLF